MADQQKLGFFETK